MANLITEKQKKTIRTEYIIRLSAASLLVAGLLGLFLLAYVVPYYVSVRDKDLKVAEQFQNVISAENKENVGESASRIVSTTLEELKTIEVYAQGNIIPSEEFIKIIENKNPDIRLTRLSFNKIKKGQGQILVSGLAKNREGLVDFIEALKSKARFNSVDSPISDFAKDSDISFTLNIKTTL